MLKVNEYFSGSVKSISFETATQPATVGVMEQGEYEFSTGAKETMVVISGELAIQFPGKSDWQSYVDGQAFEVEGNSSFKVKAVRDTAYLCKFWK
ncbi:MAG: pyrimidine/purine nucleoside phosphorylase [Cellvibrionaceae bacterium]|nr:pyrimidine/purine nucleoside phosphorylase [Cellvibrionaceae bacterium]